jgi:hypothetical protein
MTKISATNELGVSLIRRKVIRELTPTEIRNQGAITQLTEKDE